MSPIRSTTRGRLPLPGPQDFDAIARATLLELGARATAHVKQIMRTGRDRRGIVGRVDTGQAVAAVGASAPMKGARGWELSVGIGPPRSQIAGVLEKGRRPGRRMPPLAPILAWVRRKLAGRIGGAGSRRPATLSAAQRRRGQAWEAVRARERAHGRPDPGPFRPRSRRSGRAFDTEALRLAKRIQRSIARKGTPGLGMFEQTREWLRRSGVAQQVTQQQTARVMRARGSRGR